MNGILGTRYIDTVPGQDDAYVRSLQTRSGLDLADLFPMVDAAMAAINEGANPIVARLVFPTTAASGRRRRITRKTVQEGGEFTIARSQVGSSVGGMYAIKDYEIAFGWTEKGIHKASLQSIQDELTDMVDAFQALYLGLVLERLFSAAEVRIDDGVDVFSPGFAGSGTGANVFSGLFPNGISIPGGYSHYYVSTDAGLMASILAQVAQHRKWGRGPLDLIGSPEAIERIIALSSTATYGANAFTPAGSVLIRPAQGEREANVDANDYLGVIAQNVRVMEPVEQLTDDSDTGWYAIVRSAGSFDQNNILAWRYDETWGRDAFVRTVAAFPLADAVVFQSLGINVANRTGATVAMIDPSASSYAAPAIVF
jgi:hypothetical protein